MCSQPQQHTYDSLLDARDFHQPTLQRDHKGAVVAKSAHMHAHVTEDWPRVHQT